MNKILLNTSAVAVIALTTINEAPRILLLKRTEEGFWSHVSGKVEVNETASQAALREFKEETDVSVDNLYSADYIEQFYEPHKNWIRLVPIFVVFLASDTEIYMNEEHTEYKWCSLEEAKSLVPFPNQRAVYDHVWEVFVKNKPSELMRLDIS